MKRGEAKKETAQSPQVWAVCVFQPKPTSSYLYDILPPFRRVSNARTPSRIHVAFSLLSRLHGILSNNLSLIQRVLRLVAHDLDIQTLLRTCNVHNVPNATNLATADLIISADLL